MNITNSSSYNFTYDLSNQQKNTTDLSGFSISAEETKENLTPDGLKIPTFPGQSTLYPWGNSPPAVVGESYPLANGYEMVTVMESNGSIDYLFQANYSTPSTLPYLSSSGTVSIDQLSQEKQAELKALLEQSAMSLQDWANFNFELLVNEVITHSEFYQAMGEGASASDSNGIGFTGGMTQREEALKNWTGDPETWIKNQYMANLSSGCYHLSSEYVNNTFTEQKQTFEKILDIIDQLSQSPSQKALEQWESDQVARQLMEQMDTNFS